MTGVELSANCTCVGCFVCGVDWEKWHELNIVLIALSFVAVIDWEKWHQLNSVLITLFLLSVLLVGKSDIS